MFHLMFGLIAISIALIVGTILLSGIALAVISVFGGTSAALLVKNRTVRRLLFLGCGILLLVAALCLAPFVGVYAGLTADIFQIASIIMLSLIGILSFVGVRTSNSITNKIGKIISIIIFSVMCVIAITLAIFIGVLSLI